VDKLHLNWTGEVSTHMTAIAEGRKVASLPEVSRNDAEPIMPKWEETACKLWERNGAEGQN
jgi:hypothetical protein